MTFSTIQSSQSTRTATNLTPRSIFSFAYPFVSIKEIFSALHESDLQSIAQNANKSVTAGSVIDFPRNKFRSNSSLSTSGNSRHVEFTNIYSEATEYVNNKNSLTCDIHENNIAQTAQSTSHINNEYNNSETLDLHLDPGTTSKYITNSNIYKTNASEPLVQQYGVVDYEAANPSKSPSVHSIDRAITPDFHTSQPEIRPNYSSRSHSVSPSKSFQNSPSTKPPIMYSKSNSVDISQSVLPQLRALREIAEDAAENSKWVSCIDTLQRYVDLKLCLYDLHNSESIVALVSLFLLKISYSSFLAMNNHLDTSFEVLIQVSNSLGFVKDSRLKMGLKSLVYNNMSNVYIKKKKKNAALKYAQLAFHTWKSVGCIKHTFYFLFRLALMEMQAKKYALAQKHFELILNLDQHECIRTIMQNTYEAQAHSRATNDNSHSLGNVTNENQKYRNIIDEPPFEFVFLCPQLDNMSIENFVSPLCLYNLASCKVSQRKYANVCDLVQKAIQDIKSSFHNCGITSHPWEKTMKRMKEHLQEISDGSVSAFDHFKMKITDMTSKPAKIESSQISDKDRRIIEKLSKSSINPLVLKTTIQDKSSPTDHMLYDLFPHLREIFGTTEVDSRNPFYEWLKKLPTRRPRSTAKRPIIQISTSRSKSIEPNQKSTIVNNEVAKKEGNPKRKAKIRGEPSFLKRVQKAQEEKEKQKIEEERQRELAQKKRIRISGPTIYERYMLPRLELFLSSTDKESRRKPSKISQKKKMSLKLSHNNESMAAEEFTIENEILGYDCDENVVMSAKNVYENVRDESNPSILKQETQSILPLDQSPTRSAEIEEISKVSAPLLNINQSLPDNDVQELVKDSKREQIATQNPGLSEKNTSTLEKPYPSFNILDTKIPVFNSTLEYDEFDVSTFEDTEQEKEDINSLNTISINSNPSSTQILSSLPSKKNISDALHSSEETGSHSDNVVDKSKPNIRVENSKIVLEKMDSFSLSNDDLSVEIDVELEGPEKKVRLESRTSDQGEMKDLASDMNEFEDFNFEESEFDFDM